MSTSERLKRRAARKERRRANQSDDDNNNYSEGDGATAAFRRMGDKPMKTSSSHRYKLHRTVADSSTIFAINNAALASDRETRGDGNDYDELYEPDDEFLQQLSVADIYGSDEEVLLGDSEEAIEIDDIQTTQTNQTRPTRPTNMAKSVDPKAPKQYRTLELRELRKLESLTAFGQSLSEIELHNAEWSPQRRANTGEVKGHADRAGDFLPSLTDTERTTALSTNGVGFELEALNHDPPRPSSTTAIMLEETQHEVYLYRDNFIQFNEAEQILTIEVEHYHWLGVMTLPLPEGANKKAKRKQEPIAITITQDNYISLSRFIGIIRTVRSDHAFSLETALLGKHQNHPKPKALLQAMKKINPMIKDAKLWRVEDVRICERLLVFEDVMKYFNYKFACVLCKEGQTTEEEMLSNVDSTPEFERFLNMLGERIELKGWQGYTADLDTKMDASGKHSVYTQWHDFSVMFHVSTLLPFDPKNEQQVGRKRYIGNDLVGIIFQSSDDVTFEPPCIVSNMLHVFIVVRPMGERDGVLLYKVSVVSKNGVPSFGPALGEHMIFEEGPYFREWLLTKLVNAERASLHHPWLSAFIKKTRRGQLDDILKDFVDERRHKKDKPNNAAEHGVIAATAQTVARLKKRHRSQVQSPQAIGRAASAPTRSNETVFEGGPRFEKLDGSIEWICDNCQKNSAVYKVMVATGAQLTLCAACAEELGAKPSEKKEPSPLGLSATSASPTSRRRLERASSNKQLSEARPQREAPAPPTVTTGTLGAAAGQKALLAKMAPPASPRDRKHRARMSLDSAELDGILTALKRDKLRTPVRANRPRGGTDNKSVRSASNTTKAERRASSLRKDGDETQFAEAKLSGFEARLAELDRRIQALNEDDAASSNSDSRSPQVVRRKTSSRRASSALTTAPPPLPPDELLPKSMSFKSEDEAPPLPPDAQ